MPMILYTYIMREISGTLILSCGILSITLLLSKSIKMASLVINHGVGLTVILKFLFLLMPSFLIYTIPISFLLATLITFNKLSGDNEVTAMRASGISLYSMSAPALVIAIISFLLTTYLTLFAFPWANLSAKKLMYDAARAKVSAGITEGTFNDTFEGVVLYINHIEPAGDNIRGVVVSQEKNDGTSDVIVSNNGLLISDPDTLSVTLRLKNGTLHRTGKRADKYTHMTFNTYDIHLWLKETDMKNQEAQKSNRELTIGELRRKIDSIKQEGENPSPYIIDMHKRFVLPSSVFVFGLIGIPLAIQHVRTSRYRGFIIALAVMLIYYIMSTAFEAFGEDGGINPLIAVWGSNIIMGTAGLYRFYKADRE